MKQHFSNEYGEWTEENFTVGKTYGNGRVLVIERGERQDNGDTRVVFQCTATGKTELISTGHMSVYWRNPSNARYESLFLSMVSGIVKSDDGDFFSPTR